MSTAGRIQLDLVGIGDRLLAKPLRVPRHQRFYAWQEKHVEDLLSDLEAAINGNQDEYFLGTIVTCDSDDGTPEVVDGQQRLATITILLAAIRDHFLSLGQTDKAQKVETETLLTKDWDSQLIPRLVMNQTDNEFFQKRILSHPGSTERAIEPNQQSHSRIVEAAQLAARRVGSVTRDQDAITVLPRWVEYIKESLKVTWVRVPSDSNAFTIFETLNDRGLALAKTDLLKNFLFGKAAVRLCEVQSYWVSMVSSIESVECDQAEELLLTYIRHLWSAKYGLTREKDLYSRIKASVRNQSDAMTLSVELASKAKLYSSLVSPSDDSWESYGTTAKKHMETLNQLRMVQIRPLLLASLTHLPPREIKPALRLMVSWVVRFLIHGGLGSGTLEKHYADRAQDIWEGRIKTAKELSACMAGVVPSDQVFEEAFAKATVSKLHLARYYLRVLEQSLSGVTPASFVPNDNPDDIVLEHVLPKEPSPDWDYIDKSIREAHLKRLGNMTLLRKAESEEGGNSGFPSKRQIYAQSDFKLTQELADCGGWNVSEINVRQERLARLAVAAWPLK